LGEILCEEFCEDRRQEGHVAFLTGEVTSLVLFTDELNDIEKVKNALVNWVYHVTWCAIWSR